MPRIFVYGSLLRGETNHDALAGAVYVGEATTEPRYALLDLGEYPGLVEGSARVVGEVYDVSDEVLATLDVLEDHPRLFRRKRIALEGTVACEAYFLCAIAKTASIVAGGDWRAIRCKRR